MAFTKRFIISTEDVNAYGFWVRTEGIDLNQAQKNCPAFYNHNTLENLPIGRWTNFSIVNGNLEADIIIAGTTDYEKSIIEKIENRELIGASIGANILATDSNTIKQGQQYECITECELYEVSLTSLPANRGAFIKNGIQLSQKNIHALLPKIVNPNSLNLMTLKETPPQNLALNEAPVKETESAAPKKTHNLSQEQVLLLNRIKKGAALTDSEAAFFDKLSERSIQEALSYYDTLLSYKAQKNQNPKLSTLIKEGSIKENTAEESYLQLSKENPQKLGRIRDEDPAKYKALADAYLATLKHS